MRLEILNKIDHKVEPVAVPEWDATVHVRSFSAGDRAKLMSLHREHQNDPAILNIHLVILACCDSDGRRMFEAEDFGALLARNADAIDRIVEAALRLNHLDADAVEAAKKNSSKTPS